LLFGYFGFGSLGIDLKGKIVNFRGERRLVGFDFSEGVGLI
jgi:hypothetical protein